MLIAKEQKAVDELDHFIPNFRKAVVVYRDRLHRLSFTKTHIQSIILFAFNTNPIKQSGRKREWLKQLKIGSGRYL